jgi:hypothetical protein
MTIRERIYKNCHILYNILKEVQSDNNLETGQYIERYLNIVF